MRNVQHTHLLERIKFLLFDSPIEFSCMLGRETHARVSLSISKSRRHHCVFFFLFWTFSAFSFVFYVLSLVTKTGKIVDGIGTHLLSPRLCCDVRKKRKVLHKSYSTIYMFQHKCAITRTRFFVSLRVLFSYCSRETNIISCSFGVFKYHHNSTAHFTCSSHSTRTRTPITNAMPKPFFFFFFFQWIEPFFQSSLYLYWCSCLCVCVCVRERFIFVFAFE